MAQKLDRFQERGQRLAAQHREISRRKNRRPKTTTVRSAVDRQILWTGIPIVDSAFRFISFAGEDIRFMVGDFQVSGSQPVLAPGDLKRVRERISWDGEDPPPEGRICVWPQLERMKLWQARQYWAAVIAHDRWIRETFPEGSEFWEVTREA